MKRPDKEDFSKSFRNNLNLDLFNSDKYIEAMDEYANYLESSLKEVNNLLGELDDPIIEFIGWDVERVHDITDSLTRITHQ